MRPDRVNDKVTPNRSLYAVTDSSELMLPAMCDTDIAGWREGVGANLSAIAAAPHPVLQMPISKPQKAPLGSTGLLSLDLHHQGHFKITKTSWKMPCAALAYQIMMSWMSMVLETYAVSGDGKIPQPDKLRRSNTWQACNEVANYKSWRSFADYQRH